MITLTVGFCPQAHGAALLSAPGTTNDLAHAVSPHDAAMENMLDRLMRLARQQGGVLARGQVLASGFSDEWLTHRVSSRRWQRVHTGVYATFTGPLPMLARCWAALLFCGEGSALAGSTAIAVLLDKSPDGPSDLVVVAVDHERRVSPPDGVVVWRVSNLEAHVHPARRPRVLRLETAVLLTASRRRHADHAIGVIADACQSRRTTPKRLYESLLRLPANIRFRATLRDILEDVATGAYSYLEVQYVRRVERPHGLPTGSRQRVVRRGRHVWLRDVEYILYRVIVELDGRLGHEDYVSRCNDMDRDNAAAQEQKRTSRIGYRQTISTSCTTAMLVGNLLKAGGWLGELRPCGPDCPIAQGFDEASA